MITYIAEDLKQSFVRQFVHFAEMVLGLSTVVASQGNKRFCFSEVGRRKKKRMIKQSTWPFLNKENMTRNMTQNMTQSMNQRLNQKI